MKNNPLIEHVIEVKILSELGNGVQEVEVMIDSQPIQDYLTQAEVDQCQSHVEDPDLDPSEEPKALSNIDAEHSGMSNIQQNDTTISDPMAKREPYQEHGYTNPTVSVNQKTYNPGQELYLKVMKITKDNGIPKLHGFFLEDEDRICEMGDQIDGLIVRNGWERYYLSFEDSSYDFIFSDGVYNFENDQIVSVKTYFFGDEGEFSRGKIIDGAKADQMIIKFIDYETTELKVSRSKVFPYSKEFAGPEWVNIFFCLLGAPYEKLIIFQVSGGVLGAIDNIDWSIGGALEEFESLINNMECADREPCCVPIAIMESKDEGNFFSMHIAPDPADVDFNKFMKKYSPSEKRTVLGEVQNVPECLMPSRSRTASTKTNGSSQISLAEQETH